MEDVNIQAATQEVSKYTDIAILYASEYGLKIVAAILIFIIGKWAVKKLTAVSKKLMDKQKLIKL